jgi:hypothetical protein
MPTARPMIVKQLVSRSLQSLYLDLEPMSVLP